MSHRLAESTDVPWDIFSSDGKYLGSVAPPDGFVPMAGRGGLVAGKQTTEDNGVAFRVIRIRN